MNKLLANQTGGMPFFLNDLEFMDAAYREAFYAIMSAFGIGYTDSFILSGCVVSINGNDYSCTAGYISYLGEIYKVDAHTFTHVENNVAFYPVITYDASGNKEFKDASTKDTYQIRKAELTDIFSVNHMPYDADTIHQIIVKKMKALNTAYSQIANTNVHYRKDVFDMVTLQGVISGVEEIQLPSGNTPQSEVKFYVPNSIAGSYSEVRITVLGVISILNAVGTEVCGLAGLSFKTN